jgi:hypothetical protein
VKYDLFSKDFLDELQEKCGNMPPSIALHKAGYSIKEVNEMSFHNAILTLAFFHGLQPRYCEDPQKQGLEASKQ